MREGEILFYHGTNLGMKKITRRMYLIGPMPNGEPNVEKCKMVMWRRNAKKIIRNQFYTQEMDRDFARFCGAKGNAVRRAKKVTISKESRERAENKDSTKNENE